MSGPTDVLELLIDSGASVDRKNMDGSGPLSIACQANNKFACSLMLDRGANVRAKNIHGMWVMVNVLSGATQCREYMCFCFINLKHACMHTHSFVDVLTPQSRTRSLARSLTHSHSPTHTESHTHSLINTSTHPRHTHIHTYTHINIV